MLHFAFSSQAERTPEAIAYRDAEDSLSYAALHRRSAQLAQALLDAGVKPGDRVGLLLASSLLLPTAVQAILRAGGAFVPIDPNTPPERFAAIVREADIRVLVTEPGREALIRKCEVSLDVVFGLEQPLAVAEIFRWAAVETLPEAAPVAVSPSDLAYLMFTSGSTGTPKGIAHSHGSGYAYVERVTQTYALTWEDRIANFAPLHFDIATLGYLASPCIGAATTLIPENVQLFPRSVARIVSEQRLTIWYSAPYALQQLLRRGDHESQDFRALRWVLYGGEVFPPQDVARLMRAWPQTRFSNVYGPAEVNQCTYFHLDEVPRGDEPIPLGTTWDSTEALLLDEAEQVVTGAGAGELLIASPTQMLGYWRREDLNERCFYEFGEPPKRFFRTGDRVRRDVDGMLHFLGRADRQVKLRGYRVELDEVEAVAGRQDQVIECAAVVIAGLQQEAYLVLFVQIAAGAATEETARSLKQALRQTLPAYAVPKRLLLQPEPLPRNSSAKLDRLALARRFEAQLEMVEKS